MSQLLAGQLDPQSNVQLVKEADLPVLLGGLDPLSIPREEAGVTHAFLVSGWELDGQDEALRFISRGADDRVLWHGWMVVQGDFETNLTQARWVRIFRSQLRQA